MNNALAKPSPDENHTSDGRCKCPTRCQSDEALAWVLWLAYAGLPEDLPITWAGESHRSMWLAAGRTARERIASEPRALDGSDVTSEEVLRDAIERATKAEAALARVTGLYAALREDVEEVNEDGLIYVPGALIRRDNVRAAKEVQTKALTPERLAGIRDRDARVGWVLSKPVAYEAAEDDRTALLAHVGYLTAELEEVQSRLSRYSDAEHVTVRRDVLAEIEAKADLGAVANGLGEGRDGSKGGHHV